MSPVVPDGGDGEAVVVSAEVSAGHDGEAELTLSVRFENGVVAPVVLDAEAGFDVLAGCRAAGVGDLVGTCYSAHSRNQRLGRALGEGASLESLLAGTRMVTEGVPNTASLHEAARLAGVRTPLLDEVHALLYEGKPARDALRALLSRDPRPEFD